MALYIGGGGIENVLKQQRLLKLSGQLIIGLGILLVMTGSVSAKAKKQSVEVPAESKATFMLMPELPKDNLGGEHLGYFNLKLKKGQKRTVRLKVFNPTSQALTIYGQVEDATTLDNGVVDYLGTKSIDRQLLPQPGSQLVQVPAKTTLPANATQWVTVTVQAPKNGFKGQKATAINLSANQIAKQTAVQNHYVYAIGLILNGQKLAKKAYQQIQSPGIKTRFVKQHRAAISVKIANPDPVYLKKAAIKVNLQNQKWSLIQYQQQWTNRKIAPSSSFYADVPLGGKRLVSGAYRLTLTVKSSGNTKTLHKYVQITKGQAHYINRYNYAYLKNRNVLIVSAVLLVGLIGGWLIYRKHKHHQI
ncbi:WxL protein peptidoglycan domain-containing protein [Latilactobacillus fuchuensis]|uniref:Cell surface protein n=2 Tax=Latilactobacillus fuchuensis TaxID=164393 RepID=A0A2N9DU96_9LACO|nr:hypothetical protein FC69_GL000601 [Latilactobacillus fuchuensis DSM 14340 = JCM 11249]SPC37600.1 Cell surface protein [Latilactobacillus fuchuensis]